MNKVKDFFSDLVHRWKNRGNPNYKWSFGPEKPWSTEGESTARY